MIANDYGIKKIYYIERYPGIAMNHVNAIGDEKIEQNLCHFQVQ